MLKIIKYVMVDILRSRIVLGYCLFLLALSFSIFNLEDNTAKGLLSYLNIILIIIPLISLIYTTIYIYNSGEFIELLLSQPIRRTQLLLSIYLGIALSLLTAFLIGGAIPLIVLEGSSTAYMMILAGVLLTLTFVSLALFGTVYTRDKARGIGIAIMIWLFFSLLYDGLVLLLMFQLSDYPLEEAMIGFASLNPVDLARIFILLKMDVSALMGYTGAIINEFFGTGKGMLYSVGVMLLWIVLPVIFAVRKFRRKDM